MAEDVERYFAVEAWRGELELEICDGLRGDTVRTLVSA